MTLRAVLLNDTRVDRHHGCTSVIETIETLCAAHGISIIARSSAHSDWRHNPTVTSAIGKADCVLINGEGTIHHDRPAGRVLLEAGPYARDLGKKAFLINATWQANSAESLRLLETFDIVSVRETASEAELRSHGFAPRRIPDLALYHRPEIAAERHGVSYCDSVQGPTALALYRQMWALGAQPLPIVQLNRQPAELLRWLKRYDSKVTALLAPRHLRDAVRASWQDLRTQMNSRDDFTAAVAASELVVTGRFHMMILALAAQTPLLALRSNTHKIEATLSDAGLEPWRIVDNAASIDRPLLDRARHWHGDEGANLERYVTTGRRAMEVLFMDIARMAHNG